MSGVAATNTPPFQTAMPVGHESLSAKIWPSSKTPSSSRSISSRTRPIGGSPTFSANGLSLAGFDVRIVAHLDDVEPAILVVGRRDRVGDYRLGGEQLEAEAALSPERLAGLERLERRGPWYRFVRTGTGDHDHGKRYRECAVHGCNGAGISGRNPSRSNSRRSACMAGLGVVRSFSP